MLTCPLVSFKISPIETESQGKNQVVLISIHIIGFISLHFYSSLCFFFQLATGPAVYYISPFFILFVGN